MEKKGCYQQADPHSQLLLLDSLLQFYGFYTLYPDQ